MPGPLRTSCRAAAGLLAVMAIVSCRGPEQASEASSPAPVAEPKPPGAAPEPVASPSQPGTTSEAQPAAPEPVARDLPEQHAEPVASDLPAQHAGPCPPGMALVEGGAISKKQRARWKKLYPDADPAPTEMAPFCLDLLEATEADVAACTEVIQARPNMLPCVARGDCGANPMENLSWREAAQYCASTGKRVPTLVEWLWAAGGGTEDRKYPWGNTPPTAEHLNGCDYACARPRMDDCDEQDFKSGYCTLRNLSNVQGEDGYEYVAPVGSFPAGAGRWGHLDLAGNVAEYVKLGADKTDLVCGGSYEGTFPGFGFSLHKETCELPGASRSVRCASELRSTAQPQ